MDLIEKVDFDNAFSFIYSARPGTPAASLEDGITMEEKKHRLAILQRRINEQTLAKSEAMRHTRQRVLVTGRAKKTPLDMSGRTENNRVVNFNAGEELAGKFVDVIITDVLPNSLRGELVEESLQGEMASAV